MALATGIRRQEDGRRYGSAVALSARLTRRRLALAVAVAALVSTEILFRPLPAPVVTFDAVAWAWCRYLVECLLMGVGIMLALTLAQHVTQGWARGPAFAVYALALVAGTLCAETLRIPLQGADWRGIGNGRFWSDAMFWMAIGHGSATIRFLQERAARAADRLHRTELQRAALDHQTLEARLQLMSAQIEPHFLFNALANVKRLCRDDVDSGITMLRNLAHYLRGALPQIRGAKATLRQEADLVSAYLEILQVRMGSRLRYVIDIPHDLCANPFPPMMLLTLVENAIKHGLGPSPEGGAIVVRARSNRDELEVSVSDTGVGLGAAPTGGSGVGIANTRSRLTAMYGLAARLVLEPAAPSGLVATIRIPLIGEPGVRPLQDSAR